MKLKKKCDNKEKRWNPRTGVHIWAEERFQGSTYFHLLSNLSEGGFFIKKKLPFSVGSLVELKLELSNSNESLHVKGIVVNNYNKNDSVFIGTGIQFVDMEKEARKKIKNYLEFSKKREQNKGVGKK